MGVASSPKRISLAYVHPAQKEAVANGQDAVPKKSVHVSRKPQTSKRFSMDLAQFDHAVRDVALAMHPKIFHKVVAEDGHETETTDEEATAKLQMHMPDFDEVLKEAKRELHPQIFGHRHVGHDPAKNPWGGGRKYSHSRPLQANESSYSETESHASSMNFDLVSKEVTKALYPKFYEAHSSESDTEKKQVGKAERDFEMDMEIFKKCQNEVKAVLHPRIFTGKVPKDYQVKLQARKSSIKKTSMIEDHDRS